MTLQEIYTKYTIPPNLVRHQIEVAAVGKYVCQHWTGPQIDSNLVVKTLLLHDLGNIVKFKRPFLGELEPQAAYWEGVQTTFISTFGTNANDATEKIVAELGFSEILHLLIKMKEVWEKPGELVSWEARICEYADTCVTPVGIEGFEVRMQDLARRYGHGKDTLVYKAMKQNAVLIQENVDIDLKNLSKIDFSKEKAEVSIYTFEE